MNPTYTSPKHKVSNLNKINESLEWFGTEMSSRKRIKTRNWKKPSASERYVHFSELQHYFPMIPTYTSHMDKVSNLNNIIECARIKTWNWKKPSASRDMSILGITTLLPNDVHMDKVSNLNKIIESLDWFWTEMRQWNQIKTRKWKKTSAS